MMTTVSKTPRRSDANSTYKVPVKRRDPILMTVLTVFVLIMASTAHGISAMSFAGATGWFEIPTLKVPAVPTLWVFVLLSVVLTALAWFLAVSRKRVSSLYLAAVGLIFVIGFLVWTVAGKEGSIMPVISLLVGGLALAVPLIFGSLSGVVCERSGVINIAIEGQLLFGAFLGAVTASLFHNAYLGIIGALIGGALVGVLLALFTVTLRTDHIIVGVVLNMLVIGLTSFFYSTVFRERPELNAVNVLSPIPIPVLKDIPFIGPIFFNQSILVYLVYLVAIGLQIGLFNTRWGLRTRACGEHPKAADTVGIKVNLTRWINVVAASALAGMGGAFFTLGAGLAFSKEMTAGNGFIALAAMIIGRWSPKGAVAASLLFGFLTNLGSVMQSVGSPLPAEFMLMLPYVVTVLAVAGFVGAVRAPAAEGKPYPA